MSFSQENGYTPVGFDTIMSSIREGINTQFGTTYDDESFIGTGWYKFFYPLVQKIQENEVKTDEVFLKLQEYIETTNERIQRPSVSHPGLIDSFTSQGFIASVKPPAEADAGKIFICINLDEDADDYATKKLQACTLIKDYVAAGLVTMGDQVESITLSNGQAFDFKYDLPNFIPVLLRITLTVSENNLLTIPSDETIRQSVFDTIHDDYALGKNFEPQRYYTLNEAPWAAEVLLEWSDDAGANWHSTVFDAGYTDLYTFNLEDIDVIFA